VLDFVHGPLLKRSDVDRGLPFADSRNQTAVSRKLVGKPNREIRFGKIRMFLGG